ncbi:DNA replication/repair protein RecF [Profundibacter sp.]
MTTDLRIKELRLSHFRSHKALNLTLDDRVIAIYGANGAGKTNILEAVSMLSPGRGLRRAVADEITRKPEALGWKVSGVLQSLHQMHEIETWSEGGASRSVRIDSKSATQVALGRVARILWLVPSMDRLWTDGAEGRRRFLDRMTMSFEPSHAQSVLTYEKAMRERNRLLKDNQRDAAWYGALESQMAQAGAQIHANRQSALMRLVAAQEVAETSFPTATLTLIHPEGSAAFEDAEALMSALRESRPRDLMAGRTLIGPHRADLFAEYTAKGVPARDCSTGEQKALLISLILANARALKAEIGAPPILLLDEVAAHLDANRRAALYDEICALGAQAWMTGTGAELFDSLGERAMYLDVSESGAVSSVVTFSPT